mgnify:CR=1 FL=1
MANSVSVVAYSRCMHAIAVHSTRSPPPPALLQPRTGSTFPGAGDGRAGLTSMDGRSRLSVSCPDGERATCVVVVFAAQLRPSGRRGRRARARVLSRGAQRRACQPFRVLGGVELSAHSTACSTRQFTRFNCLADDEVRERIEGTCSEFHAEPETRISSQQQQPLHNQITSTEAD